MMQNIFVILFLMICSISSVWAQRLFTEEDKICAEKLEKIRPSFLKASNDSLFVVQNSDIPYRLTTMVRGSQAEDLEEDIYGASVGEIVGPFDGGNNMYLLKIKEYQMKSSTKIRKVQIIPKGKCKTDNILFDKYIKKYSDAIKKGKNIADMAVKDNQFVALKNYPSEIYWEGETSKTYYKTLFDQPKNYLIVDNIDSETYLVYVLEPKTEKPFKAKVVVLAKKK